MRVANTRHGRYGQSPLVHVIDGETAVAYIWLCDNMAHKDNIANVREGTIEDITCRLCSFKYRRKIRQNIIV